MGSQPTFPPSLDEIIEEFEEMEDWEERYEYLVDLGRELPALEDELKSTDNLVHGCMSTVWLVMRPAPEPSDEQTVEIVADSDSLIVKGLIVVLLSALSGKPARDVVTFDTDALFETLGLSQHLSANRKNGLFAMVQRARGLAASYAS